jgi:polyphosphate glucokinase
VVLTLGTGVGSAIFSDGRLAPHIELAHHPIHNDMTYDDYIGNAARLHIGAKKWNHRVAKTIGIVQSLLNYDLLYLGGGNAVNVTVNLPTDVRISSNDAGLTGGIHLWDDDVWETVRSGTVTTRRAARRSLARGSLSPPPAKNAN